MYAYTLKWASFIKLDITRNQVHVLFECSEVCVNFLLMNLKSQIRGDELLQLYICIVLYEFSLIKYLYSDVSAHWWPTLLSFVWKAQLQPFSILFLIRKKAGEYQWKGFLNIVQGMQSCSVLKSQEIGRSTCLNRGSDQGRAHTHRNAVSDAPYGANQANMDETREPGWNPHQHGKSKLHTTNLRTEPETFSLLGDSINDYATVPPQVKRCECPIQNPFIKEKKKCILRFKSLKIKS